MSGAMLSSNSPPVPKDEPGDLENLNLNNNTASKNEVT